MAASASISASSSLLPSSSISKLVLMELSSSWELSTSTLPNLPRGDFPRLVGAVLMLLALGRSSCPRKAEDGVVTS